MSERYHFAVSLTKTDVEEAAVMREQIRRRMDEVFADGGFVCLPTAVCPAPLRGEPTSQKKDIQARLARLTCIAGTTGRPQLSLPLGEVNGLPVGLSLIGDHGSDEELIGFARTIEKELAG